MKKPILNYVRRAVGQSAMLQKMAALEGQMSQLGADFSRSAVQASETLQKMAALEGQMSQLGADFDRSAVQASMLNETSKQLSDINNRAIEQQNAIMRTCDQLLDVREDLRHLISEHKTSQSLFAFEAQISNLRNELKEASISLNRAVYQQKKVDIVVLDDIPILSYTDDLFYSGAPAEAKLSSSGLPTSIFLKRHRRPDVSGLETKIDGRCAKHMIACFSDVAFLDVGCNYGVYALHLALLLQKAGRQEVVYAFDPGIVRDLVPFNLRMNKWAGSVEFVPVAVSDWDGVTIAYADPGHSEDNRIGRPLGGATTSWPTDVTTVDTFLAGHGGLRPAFLKIDTQGFDPEVIDGASQLIEECPVVVKTEFTPWAIETRRSASGFLTNLLKSFIVVDENRLDLGVIRADQIDEVVSRVGNTEAKWTDLMCISHKVPDREKLVRSLCGQ